MVVSQVESLCGCCRNDGNDACDEVVTGIIPIIPTTTTYSSLNSCAFSQQLPIHILYMKATIPADFGNSSRYQHVSRHASRLAIKSVQTSPSTSSACIAPPVTKILVTQYISFNLNADQLLMAMASN